MVMLIPIGLISCISLKDPSFKEILNNAQHDIIKDSVKYFTGGLPFIRPIIANSKDTIYIDSVKIRGELIKSIYAKYGLYEFTSNFNTIDINCIF